MSPASWRARPAYQRARATALAYWFSFGTSADVSQVQPFENDSARVSVCETDPDCKWSCEVAKEGIAVKPEVMIPLVGFKKELAHQEKIVRETADKVFAEQGTKVDYLVGTMIELPRAAVCADQIAERAEFFSFGTNDLTQTTLGISRDDYAAFIGSYTDPKKADHGTVRAEFGESIEQNAIHGSDSDENANIEIAFFFSESELT